MLSFKRVIDLRTQGDQQHGVIKAALEDDYHHFRVALTVSNGVINTIQGTALRTPYTLCEHSVDALSALLGKAVVATAHDINRQTDARLQCTHQLDLAGLGLATLSRHVSNRRYEVDVPRHINGRTTPTVYRDGIKLLGWEVDNDVIQSPSPFTSIPLREGMASWVRANVEPDIAEAALILRRCTLISIGRLRNLDEEKHARSWGRCYVQQPERAEQAIRVIGSTRDFSDKPSQLCADDQDWLQI